MDKKLKTFLKRDFNDCKTSDIPGIGQETYYELAGATLTEASELYYIYNQYQEETHESFNRKIMAEFGATLPERAFNALQCRRFLEEPMRDKPVATIPRIDEETAGSLNREGITKAFHLFGKYLLMDKDRNEFKMFMTRFALNAKFINDILDVFEVIADKILL